MKNAEILPRAPRLPVKAPIAYRTSPSPDWLEGWTRDISKSGVLFALPNGTTPEGRVEFVVKLSRGALQGPGVPLLPNLHCHGHIVRRTKGPEGELLVAAAIDEQVVESTETTA